MTLPSPLLNQDARIISGLRGSAVAWFCATSAPGRPVCCIVPDEQMTDGLERDLMLFADRPVISYPGYEIPPYTPLPHIGPANAG